MVWGFEGGGLQMPSGLSSFPLLFFPYCPGEILISERIASHDKLAPCTRGEGVEVMWGGGRGCAHVHRSDHGSSSSTPPKRGRATPAFIIARWARSR